MKRGFLSLTIAATSLGMLGCGQTAPPGPAKVRGTVTYQGRPLVGGMIVFTPDPERGTPGKPASATIAPDGSFLLGTAEKATIPPGWYRIAIADPPGVFIPEYGYPRFPTALRRPDRSGLTREVKANAENVFHFPIEVPE